MAESSIYPLFQETGVIRPELVMKDMTRHLYTRMSLGKVVMVVDKPEVFISNFRKQWLRFMRLVQRERSSTLDAVLIAELTRTIIRMQSLLFSIKWPPDERDGYIADVYLVTVQNALRWPPEADCATLYIIAPMTAEQLYAVTAWMRRGVVVRVAKT